MRLVRIIPQHDADLMVGAVRDDGTVVLADAGVTIGNVLENPALRVELAQRVENSASNPGALEAQGLLVARGTGRLRAPVDRGALVVNIGTNYRDHDAEVGVGETDISWFIKNRHALVAHGDPIRIPPGGPGQVDYEGELCVVFGRPCHRVDAADAWAYVGGFTLMNDVSAREAWGRINAATTPREGREAWSEMLLGKQLPTFGPAGPHVVTADEIGDVGSLQLTTRLNGEVVQDAPVSLMKIGIPDLIARLSHYFRFRPGDVLVTGSPAGVGMGRTPQRFLRDGDEVAVSVPGIGTLVNQVGGDCDV